MSNQVKVSNAFQIGLLGGLGVLTALVIGSMVTTIANIITYVFASIFIALGLDPVVRFLGRRKIKRPLAILIVVLAVLGVFGSLIWTLAPTLVSQTAHFIRQAPGLLKGITDLDWVVRLDNQFGGAIKNGLTSFGAFLGDSANWPSMLGGLVQVGLSIFNGFFASLVIIVLSIYFMASLESFKQWVYKMVRKTKRDQFVTISEQIFNSVGRYVMGQITIAIINAVLAFIMMSIVGIPFSLLLAFVAFLLALIPLVGSVSSAILIALVALSVSPVHALIAVIYSLVYMQVEAYVISPRIMQRAVDVPGSVVVVGALVGGTLLGVLGALVAIPVAASIILILRQVWMPRQETV
ncbi:MAG: AI-2E family transporter [Micrococcales bacterium]